MKQSGDGTTLRYYSHSKVRWLAPSLPFLMSLTLSGVYIYEVSKGGPLSSAIVGGIFLLGVPLALGIVFFLAIRVLALRPIVLSSSSITIPLSTRRRREVSLSEVHAVCLVLTRGPIAFQAWSPFLLLTNADLLEVYPIASEKTHTLESWLRRPIRIWVWFLLVQAGSESRASWLAWPSLVLW